jgi:hypothetical protein
MPADPYGYDPATDTVRVSRHDLARLLIQFREELERGGRARAWSHMHDFDLSFERLADAVDHAAGLFFPRARDRGPDERMRCKRTPAYEWPEHPPVQALAVAEDSRAGSHYAWLDGRGFGHALCGFTFTEDDGITPARGEPACRECVRENRLAS